MFAQLLPLLALVVLGQAASPQWRDCGSTKVRDHETVQSLRGALLPHTSERLGRASAVLNNDRARSSRWTWILATDRRSTAS